MLPAMGYWQICWSFFNWDVARHRVWQVDKRVQSSYLLIKLKSYALARQLGSYYKDMPCSPYMA